MKDITTEKNIMEYYNIKSSCMINKIKYFWVEIVSGMALIAICTANLSALYPEPFRFVFLSLALICVIYLMSLEKEKLEIVLWGIIGLTLLGAFAIETSFGSFLSFNLFSFASIILTGLIFIIIIINLKQSKDKNLVSVRVFFGTLLAIGICIAILDYFSFFNSFELPFGSSYAGRFYKGWQYPAEWVGYLITILSIVPIPFVLFWGKGRAARKLRGAEATRESKYGPEILQQIKEAKRLKTTIPKPEKKMQERVKEIGKFFMPKKTKIPESKKPETEPIKTEEKPKPKPTKGGRERDIAKGF